MFTSHETDFANGGKGNPRASWSLHFSSILSILPNFIHFIDYFSFEAQLYQIPMFVTEFCHSLTETTLIESRDFPIFLFLSSVFF